MLRALGGFTERESEGLHESNGVVAKWSVGACVAREGRWGGRHVAIHGVCWAAGVGKVCMDAGCFHGHAQSSMAHLLPAI